MTLTHHDAALGNQGCGRKAEFISPQQCTDNYVASGSQATVDLYSNPAAQAIHDKRLMRLCKA